MIRPLSNRVIVQRLEDSTGRTSGGLYIPEVAKEKPTHGVVVAVGPGHRTEKGTIVPVGFIEPGRSIAPGDKILFGKYSGSEVSFDGKELLIVREEEILGVIEENA